MDIGEWDEPDETNDLGLAIVRAWAKAIEEFNDRWSELEIEGRLAEEACRIAYSVPQASTWRAVARQLRRVYKTPAKKLDEVRELGLAYATAEKAWEEMCERERRIEEMHATLFG